MRSKTHFKAGIYFSHYECFGHTSRVIAVSEVFKKRFPQGDFFFIQAGVHQPKAQIDRLGRVYSLPKAFMDRRHFREPMRGAGADSGERADVCTDIITREKPDLLMTEFFPLGRDECRHELIPSLIQASRQGAEVWGVSGYPLLTGTAHEWRQKLFKLYKKIIIFSPLREKECIAGSITRPQERQRYLDFFKKNEDKIVFAGYLLPRSGVVRVDADEILPGLQVPKGACRVAVLRGGGAYFSKIIVEAILASDSLGEEYHLTVVTGPSTTSREWDFFVTLVNKKKVHNLELLKAVGNYEGLIKSSDVCVSVASYHTSVMLLKHRKKAVLIPFEGSGSMVFHEQPARAGILKEIMGAEILSIQDLTARTLTIAIQNAASRRNVSEQAPKDWFMGADVLDKALVGLFGR